MKTRRRLIKASTIIGYVSAFLYLLVTAYFYALSNNLYWLFIILAGISLYNSLYTSRVNSLLEDEPLEGKLRTKFLINMIISIVHPISFILNLIAFLWKKEDPEVTVVDEPKVEKPKKEKKERKWYQKANFILMCVGLGGIIVGSCVAQMGETSFYSVEVSDFTLTKAMTDEYNYGEDNALPNGNNFYIESEDNSYSVTLYRPKNATQENPLPVVFVLPGFTRTKATMAQYAIELSKRGAVVFTIDPGCQGGTSYAGYDEDGEMISSTAGANGIEYLVQYVYNNTEEFDYVDRNNFGAIGHSAGGGNVGQLAQDFSGDTYEDSVIKSVYISGYIKTSLVNRFKDFRCNAALSYAYYDEGAYRYQSSVSNFELAAKTFINNVNGTGTYDYDEAVIDYEYGDMSDGTYRVIHQEKTNHAFQMYDSVSITNVINFFRRTLNLQTDLSDSSHTWLVKEAFNGVALVCAFLLIFSLLSFLIDMVPFFKNFKAEAAVAQEYEDTRKVIYGFKRGDILDKYEDKPEVKPHKKSYLDKVLFWTIVCLSAIIACLDYIPLARLSMSWFSDAASNTYTYFFPARMMNAVMLWAVVNGLIGFFLIFVAKLIENLVYKLRGKEEYISTYRFRMMKIKWSSLGKSVLLAVGLFGLFYLLDQLCYWIFHQDFRFMLISASTLQPRFIVTWLIYLIPFFIFYLSNSVRVNLSMACEGWSEWKVYLLGAIGNSVGLIFILIINYVCYFKTGTVFYGYYSATDSSEMWLYINMLFAITVMMAVLPILNRFCFKKTGNVYLGAMLCTMIFIMMSLSASVSYIPM